MIAPIISADSTCLTNIYLKKGKKGHKKKKSGNGFGISYIRIAVSKDCRCACRLQFRQLLIYLLRTQSRTMAGVPGDFSRLYALILEGRADQIEEL